MKKFLLFSFFSFALCFAIVPGAHAQSRLQQILNATAASNTQTSQEKTEDQKQDSNANVLPFMMTQGGPLAMLEQARKEMLESIPGFRFLMVMLMIHSVIWALNGLLLIGLLLGLIRKVWRKF